MPDKTARVSTSSSSGEHTTGRWKASCTAGQDHDGARIWRSAYGQTPQEAAERLADSLDEKPHTT